MSGYPTKHYGPPKNRGNAEWKKVKDKRDEEQRYKAYLARRAKVAPAPVGADGMIGASHTSNLLTGGLT